LAAHFVHHGTRGAAHGFHRHGGEHVGDQPANEQADDHGRIGQIKTGGVPQDFLELVRVVREQHQGRETG